MSKEKYNYCLFYFFIVLRFGDLITTIIGLDMGFREANPFGFSVEYFAFSLLAITILLLYIIETKMAFYLLIFLVLSNFITVLNNLLVIL